MSTAPLLSICIPTYNRAALLRETIHSIIESSKNFENQIEIVISDDGSRDETKSIVSEIQSNSKLIKSFFNKSNMGIDDHFSDLPNRASGKYLWIFGDDDKLAPNAIKEVIARLVNNPDLVICNFCSFTKDFSSRVNERNFPFLENKTFNNPNSLLKVFGLHLGYISCVIVRNSHFLNLQLSDRTEYKNCGFPLLYDLYVSLKKFGSHTEYIAEPIVYNRSDNSGNYDWYNYFASGSTKIFNGLRQHGYSYFSIYAAREAVLRDFVARTVIWRQITGENPRNLNQILFSLYKAHLLYWTICRPVLKLNPQQIENQKEALIKKMTAIRRW